MQDGPKACALMSSIWPLMPLNAMEESKLQGFTRSNGN